MVQLSKRDFLNINFTPIVAPGMLIQNKCLVGLCTLTTSSPIHVTHVLLEFGMQITRVAGAAFRCTYL